MEDDSDLPSGCWSYNNRKLKNWTVVVGHNVARHTKSKSQHECTDARCAMMDHHDRDCAARQFLVPHCMYIGYRCLSQCPAAKPNCKALRSLHLAFSEDERAVLLPAWETATKAYEEQEKLAKAIALAEKTSRASDREVAKLAKEAAKLTASSKAKR